MQAVTEFTIAWLQRLQKLWDGAATDDDPVSNEQFRTACQSTIPPRSNTKINTAGSLAGLFQGREALMHSALYVTEMVDEWTSVVPEQAAGISGIMKHVSKIIPTPKLKQIMWDTMKQWAVCILLWSAWLWSPEPLTKIKIGHLRDRLLACCGRLLTDACTGHQCCERLTSR